MFTGIITNLGKVSKKTNNKLQIEAEAALLKQLKLGTSIAINGICLTVTAKSKSSFSIKYMPETAKKTNIHYLKAGGLVNLELPATYNSFISGHIVQGHVDTIGKIIGIQKEGNSRIFTFSTPSSITNYIVNKGSITVNGIALTVINVNKNSFTVGIIPYTWEHTMLHKAKIGNLVNIEVDILAKYVEKLL